MTLRHKIITYLFAIHLVFAVLAVFLLWDRRVWLLAVEAFFAVSILLGVKLLQSFFVPLQLIKTGTELMKESDFSTRFREVGQKEMDELIHVYNRMADHLREERIRSHEQHYFLDKILRASPSGVVTLDFDENIALCNPAAEKMLQATSDQLLRKRLSEVQGTFAAELNELRVNESRIVPLQGRRRVKCQKSVFLDRGFLRSFIVMEELTEELRHSEKAAYEKLIRMMSHEVNNSIGASNSLLHSCLNYRDQLREEDRSDFETALHVAISRTDHLNGFMRSFADVIRLPKPDLRPTDLKSLLDRTAILLKPECLSRGIAWNWDIKAELSPILMDERQIEQVFINICKNAIEAIRANGSITIRVCNESTRGLVVVEDTGCGIPPVVRGNLFSPFFTTKENGQGIGLTLVQEILSQHHFDFSLESQPNGPTRFTIYF